MVPPASNKLDMTRQHQGLQCDDAALGLCWPTCMFHIPLTADQCPKENGSSQTLNPKPESSRSIPVLHIKVQFHSSRVARVIVFGEILL